MSMYPEQSGLRKPWELQYASDEKALSKFFNVVYAWMAVGLAVTTAVAYFVAHTPSAFRFVLGNPAIGITCAIAAFVISIYVQTQFLKLSANVATALFLLYAALMGAMVSYIFLLYPARTLASAFGVTTGTFVVMSVYGMVTKRDLTRIGSILVMCVWGLLLASVINFFIASNALDWFITYAVLIAFIGITAYKTQELKNVAAEFGGDSTLAPRFAIYGSLVLYIAFINIFLSILRIIGDRK
jgi:uncharacterized protein